MPEINRRSFIGAGAAVSGLGLLAACGRTGSAGSPGGALVTPGDAIVDAVEKERAGTGKERAFTLRAAESELDLGGRTVRTWSFGDALPGEELRVSAGDTLKATLENRLPDPTSIHWHGLALRNDMDGVPPITQKAVKPGGDFTYRFIVDTPGTHWFHPHVGTQIDRGLYAPIIVDDPDEPLAYDEEWVVMLDDWLDGIDGTTPDAVLEEVREGMDHGGGGGHGGHGGGEGGMEGMDGGGPMRMGNTLMGASSDLLGGDAGDIYYPLHLVNGRPADDPRTFKADPGARLRLRLINAGGDTAYRVVLGGHRMTITHTDGYPVEHREVDGVVLGMGERYDVLVTLKDGVFPLVVLAEGKDATALGLVRTGSGEAPGKDVRPDELDGKIVHATELKAAPEVRLEKRGPEAEHTIELTGGMGAYDWALNGRRFDHEDPTKGAFTCEQGQRVRVVFKNSTMMWHPMHLHGHTFQIADGGPRKDTVIVLPGQSVKVDFEADNPGQWLVHCHNIYHGEVGMMGLLAYTA
ncbi:multicopper oxidase family protein [Nocardiopsis sp. RSe5-2]|uniref:Multicopper oxidase family protein n=1 Tax=Nocardiopsis endophytica TaxID=3018445 RepID=A0ABT4U910_9ACTN|nr:multicopper oxidase family protein [Nocardiopsis endophytica]MDA2813434.1 multicopper oxidase family protein [Nocardiopsis endophytica]